MPTPEHHGPPPSASAGYEIQDVNPRGIVVFLVSLGVFVGVFFVVCFGLGMLINTALKKHDGVLNKWNAAAITPSHGLENLTSNALMEQRELHAMTQAFPTPRLQTNDGDQDVADLHAREDLLLDHYSWVDRKKGVVRIPIERAMELLVKSGLPVAPQGQPQDLMMGDKPVEVPAPLTNGFARTGYEQQVLETMQQQRMRGEKPSEQVALNTNR
jgi:hypothetical protein